MKAAVIGSGPAGLMAAETMAQAGAQVTIYEQKPSAGRKFLMAGKSGLNLTMDEPRDALIAQYDTDRLHPVVGAFDAAAVQDWATGLGQPVFTGSSGRVFPEAMKASPLLRAWLARLDGLGVALKTRWRWTGWDDAGLVFDTPDGQRTEGADAVVLACGGASWARLGADGAWASTLARTDIALAPFAPANAALAVNWSDFAAKHFGKAVKAVAWRAGSITSRGEAILSAKGLEGGGIYTLSPAVRDGAPVSLDLLPDLTLDQIVERIDRPRGKSSLANHLRKVLKLPPEKAMLLQEWGRPLPPKSPDLAYLIKHLTVRHAGFRPIDEAISTAGGVPWGAIDDTLMLTEKPGTFVAGEMIDWDAPTGGYLITACLATGRHAGEAALRWMDHSCKAAM